MTSTKAQQAISEITSNLNSYPEWEDRYRHIIKLGQALPPMDPQFKIEENKVRGCQSQVWLQAELREGRVFFSADSDAAIVKGLIAILVSVYSGLTPKEILDTPPDFIQNLGLNTNLSQARANGLVAMIKQIKFYALAFGSLA